MSNSKLEEARNMNRGAADALMKEGNSLNSRTLFRWKPDYDGAATKYEKAANLYRNLKLYKEAKNAFLKAAEAHYKAENLYLAGKDVELAGNIARDEKETKEASIHYEKAGRIYREDGKEDRGAEMLVKAANITEDKERAVSLYKQALEIYENAQEFHKAGDAFRQFNAFLLRNGMYKECIENMQKQATAYEALKQNHNIWKCYLSIVILYLKLEDWVKASEAHQKFIETPGYADTEESYLAQSLLDCVENRDEDQLQRQLQSSRIKFLENQVAKVAKTLKIPAVFDKPIETVKAKAKLDSTKQELFGDDEEEIKLETKDQKTEQTTTIGESQKQPEENKEEVKQDEETKDEQKEEPQSTFDALDPLNLQ